MHFRPSRAHRFRIAAALRWSHPEDGGTIAMSSYSESRRRAATVCVSVFALLMAPGGTFAAWLQAQAPAPATATSARVATAVEDWPRRYHAPDGAQIVIYEPQVAGWEGQRLMTLYS